MIVHTETGSIYKFDLDNSTVQRYCGDESNELRRDGETVKLLDLPDLPVVGESLVMLLDIREDGVKTIRETSRVTRIEP